MPDPYFTSGPSTGVPGGIASKMIAEMNAGQQGFQAFGDAVDKFVKIRQNGKIADAFVKTNPEALDSLGMSEDQFGSLSAMDKAGAMTGLLQGQGYQKAKGEMAEWMARINDWNAQAKLREQQAKEDAAVGTGINRLGSGPPAPATPGTQDLLQGLQGLTPDNNADGGGGPDVIPAAASAGAMMNPLAPTQRNADWLAQFQASQTPQAKADYALQTPGLGGRGGERLLKDILSYSTATGKKQDNSNLEFGTSPSGTPYAKLGKTFSWDKPLIDVDSVKVPSGVTPVPNGKGGVTYLRNAKQTPPNLGKDFDKMMGNFDQSIADSNRTLNMSDAVLAAQIKASGNSHTDPSIERQRAQQNLNDTTSIIKGHVDRLFGAKRMDQDFRDQLYQQYNLDGDAGKAGATTAPQPDATGRVKVIRPDGKMVTVPAAQVDQAKAMGYKLAP